MLLARHPEADERLWREISEPLGDRLPCAADLPRLSYAEAVAKESLRLYPPAYVIGREALADSMLGGYAIPARATIYFSPWVLHRDPRWFEGARTFPSRALARR